MEHSSRSVSVSRYRQVGHSIMAASVFARTRGFRAKTLPIETISEWVNYDIAGERDTQAVFSPFVQ
jgi:hypothetical protein